jgi:DNA-binding CsgD family transcriptional regulator
MVDMNHKYIVMKTINPIALTKREIQIIEQVAEGKNSRQIAERLHLSVNTVFTHRKNILRKTGAKNIMAVIILATRHRLISLGKPAV